MKSSKLFAALTVALLMITNTLRAQPWSTNVNGDTYHTNTTKYVGIGNTTPKTSLDILKVGPNFNSANPDGAVSDLNIILRLSNYYNSTGVGTSYPALNEPSIVFDNGVPNGSLPIGTHAWIAGAQVAGSSYFRIGQYQEGATQEYNEYFRITSQGKILIGSAGPINKNNNAFNTTSNNYSLFVGKGILTEKIKVASSASINWSDFVFDKNYNLRPLSEVESFIKENHHLPEIPSAEEVNANGVDLLEMDAKLLMKVEELTLYMIELKKQNDGLIKQTELMKEEIRILKNRK